MFTPPLTLIPDKDAKCVDNFVRTLKNYWTTSNAGTGTICNFHEFANRVNSTNKQNMPMFINSKDVSVFDGVVGAFFSDDPKKGSFIKTNKIQSINNALSLVMSAISYCKKKNDPFYELNKASNKLASYIAPWATEDMVMIPLYLYPDIVKNIALNALVENVITGISTCEGELKTSKTYEVPTQTEEDAANVNIWETIQHHANTGLYHPQETTQIGVINNVDNPFDPNQWYDGKFDLKKSVQNVLERAGDVTEVGTAIDRNNIQRWSYDLNDYAVPQQRINDTPPISFQRIVIGQGSLQLWNKNKRGKLFYLDTNNLDNRTYIIKANSIADNHGNTAASGVTIEELIRTNIDYRFFYNNSPLVIDSQIVQASIPIGNGNGNCVCYAVNCLSKPTLVDTHMLGTQRGQGVAHACLMFKYKPGTFVKFASIGFGYGNTMKLDSRTDQQKSIIPDQGGGNVQVGGMRLFDILAAPFKKTARIMGSMVRTVKLVAGRTTTKVLTSYAQMNLPKADALWSQVHSNLQGSIYSPDTTIYSRIKKMDENKKNGKDHPTIQIIDNKQYYMTPIKQHGAFSEKNQGMVNDDICLKSSARKKNGNTECVNDDKTMGTSLKKVFGVQFKLMIVNDKCGCFILAEKVYNYLTSTKYTALSAQGDCREQNCSSFVVDFFGGVLDMKNIGGAACCPNSVSSQSDLAQTAECDFELKGGRKTRRKKRKKGKQTKKKFK